MDGTSTKKLKQFEVSEEHMNQGTRFPILDSYCSCGQRFGYHQSLIESELGKFIEKDTSESSYSDKISRAKVHFIKKYNLSMMCCELRLMSYSFLPVNDLKGKYAVVNITSKTRESNDSHINDFSKKIDSRTIGYSPFQDKIIDFDEFLETMFSNIYEGKKNAEEIRQLFPTCMYFPRNSAWSSKQEPLLIKTRVPVPFS